MGNVLTIMVFWGIMALIAASAMRSSAYTRREILVRVGRALPLVVAVVVFCGVTGFFVSGATGLVGSAIAAVLWGGWLSVTWASQKRS